MWKILQTYCRFCPKRSLKQSVLLVNDVLPNLSKASTHKVRLSHIDSQVPKPLKQNLVSNANDPVPITNEDSSYFGGVNVQEIAEGDPEIEKTLKILILEVDMFRQDGQLVPDHLKDDHWRELLALPSRSSRIRFLTFLFKMERKEENKKRKAEDRRLENEKKKKECSESDHIHYGFGGSTIFLRVYSTTMDSYLNKNLINAAQFSQPLIVDCSYDDYMTRMEARNCAKQLTYMFSVNRNHEQPFHLQFCNANFKSVTMEAFQRYVPPMFEKSFPLFITENSYLDLYPREKLVYLTPHCKTDLVEWNHDDVYIIGAMVDKTNPKPLSLAKAKEQGLRMAKLPLERHLVWGSGASKNLTLNQMISITLDMRHTGNWEKAFQHIPRRKIVSDEELVEEARERKIRNMVQRRARNNGEVFISDRLIQKVKPRKFDVNSLYD